MVKRVTSAAALAVLAWAGWSPFITPTPLEAQYHHGCGNVIAYIECLAGGRPNSVRAHVVIATRSHPDLTRATPVAGMGQICYSKTDGSVSYANGASSNGDWNCYAIEREGYGA